MEPEPSTDTDPKIGSAIVKGIVIGTPTTLVLLTLAIWLITDNDLGDSLATALLPGFLLGIFAGGFAGMATVLD